VELRDYVAAARRRWWIIVAGALAGATFAWITAPGAQAQPNTLFEAVHALTVEPEARVFTPENPETIAILATSGELPPMVAARVGEDAGGLLGKVTIVGDGGLGVVSITAKDRDSTHAEEIADAYALTLVSYLDAQEQLAQEDAINTASTRASELDAEAKRLDGELAADPNNEVLRQQRDAALRQYSAAYERYSSLLAEPRADSGLKSLGPSVATEVDAGIAAPRSRTQRAAVLGFLGAVLGLVVAIVLQRTDTRIASKEEAEAAFGMPVIAEIPTLPYRRRRLREVISFAEPASPIAEAYRVLRTTMMILAPTPLPPVTSHPAPQRRRASDFEGATALPAPRPGADLRVFMVTSTRPSEGKTTTVANLAAGFAEAGRSVLVIGADIRRPEMHEYLGVHRAPGLTDVLRGTRTLEQAIMPTSIPGVHAIPAGAAVTNPGEMLLEGPALLAEARELADVVLVDTTPMLTVNDAIQLMPGVDAVLVTSRTNRTTVQAARRAHELLARVHVPVCGVVLVGAPSTPGVSSYYYGYQTSLSSSPFRRLLRRRDGGPVDDQLPVGELEAGDRPMPPAPEPRAMPPAPAPETRREEERPPPTLQPVPERRAEPAPPAAERRGAPTPPAEPPARPRTNGAHPPAADREPDPWGWP
jgi:capsular exopolysaccharide synthesis family protein